MPQLSTQRSKSADSLHVVQLANEDKEEVLNFLSLRPIHTVCMASYIRDHGIVSPLNRGAFFGCRNNVGALEGVALIGHATLLETQNHQALKIFAQLKHERAPSHLVRGEHEMVTRFWNHFEQLGHSARLCQRELLFEQRRPVHFDEPIPDLRPAREEDLDAITSVNASMAFAESGVNPLLKDPVGFRDRVARRISQGRVWVWAKEERLMFKADIFAETPEMIYLEGIQVHPMERGKHLGLRCMAQLGEILLKRSKALCLLVNEDRKELSHFYSKAGYEFRGHYDTIYFATYAN
jgi:uncharacterized protein